MIKRYSATLLLLVTLCAGAPAVRAQVLQIEADGSAHKIGPGWSEPRTSRTINATPAANSQYVIPAAAPQTLQLLSGGAGLLEYDDTSRLQAVRDYVARKQKRPDRSADAATLARAGYAHIRDVNYDPNGVVRLAGCVGFQTTIEFASDEHIENVGMGAASRWLVVPNKRADMLFVEPSVALNHSNLTVITDRHHYYFELVSRDSDTCSRGDVIYSLRLHAPTTPDALLQSTAWRNPQ
jgi:Conjugal transfer protein